MRVLTIILAVGALMSGLWAAYKWLEASSVQIDHGYTHPDLKPGATVRRFGIDLPRIREPSDPTLRQIKANAATMDAVAASVRLNKEAAVWTSASVALSSVAAFLGALG